MNSKGIAAESKRVFLLGRGISNSLSLPIHNAAFEESGINARYELYDLGKSSLARFMLVIARSDDVLGFNVTKPFKEEIIKFLSSLDSRSKSIGAVNTVKVLEGRKLEGYNTDYDGITASLRSLGALGKKERSALVLGAGGAARACISVLLENDYTSVTVLNRTIRKTQKIAKEFSENFQGERNLKIHSAHLTKENISKSLEDGCGLVINAVSASNSNYFPVELDFSNASKNTKVFDLAYRDESLLLKIARRRKLETIDGLLMLVVQAAKSFEIWTGRSAPKKAMMKAAEKSRRSNLSRHGIKEKY